MICIQLNLKLESMSHMPRTTVPQTRVGNASLSHCSSGQLICMDWVSLSVCGLTTL